MVKKMKKFLFFILLFPLCVKAQYTNLMTWEAVSNYVAMTITNVTYSNMFYTNMIFTNHFDFDGTNLYLKTNQTITNFWAQFLGGTNVDQLLNTNSFDSNYFTLNGSIMSLSTNVQQFGLDARYFVLNSSTNLVFTNVWEDIVLDGLASPSCSGEAALTMLPGSTNLELRAFSGGGSDDNRVIFTARLPHDWYEGSVIKPMVNVVPFNSATGYVVMSLNYTWANSGGRMTNFLTQLITNAVPAVTNCFTNWSFTALTGSGKYIGSQIIMELKRLDSDAADTYGTNLGLLGLTLRYQKDSIGSINETTK